MLKYFEQRRIKKQKELEKKFDLVFKQFMREEMYAKYIK